jgi:hypothetical protein
MNTNPGFLWVCTGILLSAGFVRSQHWVNPNVECHRIDLRDLGYPEVNQIPANSRAVTSLLTGSNAKIYGGTSGDEAYLFVYDPSINKVKHLGKIPGQEGIHHALAQDARGYTYIGTGKSILRRIGLTKKIPPGRDSISNTLWNDIKAAYSNYEGGHLYRYNSDESENPVSLPDDECPLKDLGIPIRGNGIYALTSSPCGGVIYGISYPDGHLFEYDIAAERFKDLGELDEKVIFHGPERDQRSLPRALACDESGKVYTSGTDGFLVSYDPKAGKIQSSGLKVPGEYYPVEAYSGHPVVEYFAKAGKQLIYGGSSDGFLFVFDPVEHRLVNLGKPRISRRVRALSAGRNGLIYIIAGERDEPCRLFSFDPNGEGFRDLGIVAVDRSPYYSWRGYQFDSMTTGLDGTVYLGESERRSHLFLYVP